jgi:hypothetical protein
MTMESNKRNSLWFAGAVGLIAALAYSAIGVLPSYEYRTDVFVGEYATDDGFQSFEPVAATERFVLDTLLTAPTNEELRKLGVREARLGAIISVVEAGKVIRIQTVAAEDGIERLKAIHSFVADGILARLKPRAMYVRARLDTRLSSAEESLKSASNNQAVFSEIVADAKASEARTREQARKLAEQIATLDGSEQGSPPPAGARENAGNETAEPNIRGQLAMYQKLGLAEIPFLRADSARTIVALEQTINQSRQTIKDLTDQVAVFREPAVTQFLSRSHSPTRPGRLMQLLVGLVAGLAAFFVARIILRRISG